ncbi:mannose-1-phosphate guanylyltransferase [Porphyromonas levii]|uniref:mannose-1-phosphate guanylyltransferase n=1 Tax=Porphyromonas levii TaxID=28114 RepID=UPI0003760C53|nr:mannose-1-phosphate guanylyltransferase [Porphyromonas levii]MBR8703899.1 Alginate biosynthesis protein AlgA [Porphyromonas levii]MBR8729086.1 Alginate biosynthesis protein AlgA [Porphyromonas levii]MBR8759657.1 Alginate biosynthesis protein AlgA [Porphyromonas levii]MBR8774077.1 Alginate biosynthesis protein AlgA [Porphyromonas levii]MBR8784497.1 Alginate biosynthesis protein AlgA [Porphyromonas levii]
MNSLLNDNYCVIMAGGIGSRFWPWSRQNRPKQFLDILGSGRSMILETFDRFDTLVPEDNVLVVTGKKFEKMVLNELPALHPSQVLTEPDRRNTAPAIAYAAYKIASINPDAVMIVSPADQHITNIKAFRETLLGAVAYVKEHNCLMTIGIPPTYPATGYGYIELGEEAKATGVGPIVRFKEKPCEEEAVQLLATGNYVWNSGMFVWRVRDIISALEKYLPEVAVHFAEINVYGQPGEIDAVSRAFLACPSISIDYGVMEVADNVACIQGTFDWDDLGTWQSLQQHLEHHPTLCTPENTEGKGKVLLEDSSRTMVHQGVKHKDIVVVGLEDYLIVDLDDTLLIAPKKDDKRLHQLLEKYAKQLKKQ